MSKRNLNFINYAYAIGAILVVLGFDAYRKF